MKINKFTIQATIYGGILVIAGYFLLNFIPIALAYAFMVIGSLMYWWGEGKTEWFTWVGNKNAPSDGLLPQVSYHNWRIVEQAGTGLFIYGMLVAEPTYAWTFGIYLMWYPVYLWQVKKPKEL